MAHTSKDGLLALIRDGKPMTLRQQLLLTASLSVPAIMAQLSSIIMQYIDASMVGSLGADDSASIGLVSTTLWLFGGICSAVTTGFTVQVAHLLGAKGWVVMKTSSPPPPPIFSSSSSDCRCSPSTFWPAACCAAAAT